MDASVAGISYQPTTSSPSTQPSLLSYISCPAVKSLAHDVLDFFEALENAVVQETKSGISIRVNGKVFANIWPKRKHFVLGFFLRGTWTAKSIGGDVTIENVKGYFEEQEATEVNSWNMMLGLNPGCIQRTEEAIEAEGKKRGRPRKWFPKVEGKLVHRLDDDKPIENALHLSERCNMITDFRSLDVEVPIKERVEWIADLYQVTYPQAYHVLQGEL